MAEQKKKENKYNNDLGILIEKVNMTIKNLVIAHYAISDKKLIILKKDNKLYCIDALIDYKKDSSLTLIPLNKDDKSYDTANINTLLILQQLIMCLY